MQNSIKKALIFTLLPILLIAAAFVIWSYAFASYGHLRVKVVDAYNLSPIQDALVSVAENDVSLVTDDSGVAYFQDLSLDIRKANGRMPEINWAERTLICQKEGYRPSVLFYAQVYESKVRRLTLYMFPQELEDTEIITISETPDEEWIRKLVNNYGQ